MSKLPSMNGVLHLSATLMCDSGTISGEPIISQHNYPPHVDTLVQQAFMAGLFAVPTAESGNKTRPRKTVCFKQD